jgi:signal transduction histidine kinase
LVQGFLIDLQAVEAWLQPTSSPTRFLPVDAAGDRTHATLDLPAIHWCVAADPTEATHMATERADRLLADFRQSFAFGSGSAVLAAVVVLFLLWQADRLAQQRSRFAASAAHELRTPLSSLRLYGEMLQDPALGDPTKRDEYARRVAEEAERLGRVVTNVLGFTRLERGALSVQAKAGDLDAVVREGIERMRPLVEARGARLEYSVEPRLPQVWFDAEAVHQILQNLVDNAEKYGRSEDHRIEVTLQRSETGARLAVRDHGPGVPHSLGHRVFDAFQRGEAPDAPAGLGLGLALVQSLARAQGARAGVDTPAGGGARFTVDFKV